ncbi:hypothetical protein GCM10011583_57360 [Streptomyces camponoticapitis]|uniref:Uncharacterized protein n=1 Tax=Streptomyces camponoticapitis TaxID=1616125 RepID=A0ABQ2ER04_9ACTN|nr:hypothetical protein GCM10011583_57360 [Streptomyces camponoticapitis]
MRKRPYPPKSAATVAEAGAGPRRGGDWAAPGLNETPYDSCPDPAPTICRTAPAVYRPTCHL